jgi:hypothetical protein
MVPRGAAIYNILRGAFMAVFPLTTVRVLGMAVPNDPEIWQCVRMIVGGAESACALANRARGLAR